MSRLSVSFYLVAVLVAVLLQVRGQGGGAAAARMSANAGAPLVLSTAQNKAMTQLTPRGCCWSCTREERGGREEAGEVWRARCTRRKGSVGPKALSSSKTPLPRAPVHRRPPPAADQDDHGRPRPLGPQALSEWRANKEAPTAKSKKDDGSNVGRHTRQKKKKTGPRQGPPLM